MSESMNVPMNTSERIDELEARLAFQEDSLHQLSTALGDQQLQVARLEDTCKALLERVRTLQGIADELSGDNVSVERPPHY